MLFPIFDDDLHVSLILKRWASFENVTIKTQDKFK
jgi:hypothetical protein